MNNFQLLNPFPCGNKGAKYFIIQFRQIFHLYIFIYHFLIQVGYTKAGILMVTADGTA